jgi:hypothetical protein
LGAEHGFALGGGRMASLFAEALFAEGGSNAVLAGLRVYFGQHDKTLIDRHRQDDPSNYFDLLGPLTDAEIAALQRNPELAARLASLRNEVLLAFQRQLEAQARGINR